MPARSHAVRRRRATTLVLALAALALLAAPAGAAGELLKRGTRGPAVVELQRALRIPTDGVFGPQTARAVRRFQARHGLVVDGVVGPQTAAALGLARTRARGASDGALPRPLPRILERIAQCESGGNPRAVSAGGTYRGKYQFSRATWRAMGGTGDPARASEAEQDRRALALLRARGTAPWPACA
jgi:peptidoglycan hydrolase-like protein with peptidoglycan-binding domain